MVLSIIDWKTNTQKCLSDCIFVKTYHSFTFWQQGVIWITTVLLLVKGTYKFVGSYDNYLYKYLF